MSLYVHPVDQRLPLARLIPLAIQHVLVMYAGAVAVPLIIGRAVNLPPEQVARPINAALFAGGLATILPSIGLPGIGSRLPVMMGVTLASVGAMLSIAAAPKIGLPGIHGALIGAGVFGVLVAPLISRLLPLVATRAIIRAIGNPSMRVGINWAGGGLQTFTKMIDRTPAAVPNPAFGQLTGRGIAPFAAAEHF